VAAEQRGIARAEAQSKRCAASPLFAAAAVAVLAVLYAYKPRQTQLCTPENIGALWHKHADPVLCKSGPLVHPKGEGTLIRGALWTPHFHLPCHVTVL